MMKPPASAPIRPAVLARRLAHALLGGALAGALASAVDAAFARAPGPGAASYASLVSADFGLVAPLVYAVSFAVGLALLAADPRRAWAPRDVGRVLRVGDAPARGRRAAFGLLTPLAAFVWVVTVANVTRALLSSAASSAQAGSRVALFAVGCALALSLLTAALAGSLAGPLSRLDRVGADPLSAWVGSLLVVSALVAVGIASGTPGGGGGALGVLGVLKRQELDLRGPGLLLLVAAGAALGPGLLRPIFGPLAFALALVPSVLAPRAASELDASPPLAAALERDAPLGKAGLGLARRLFDGDGDGFARTFGGGDCNDRDDRVYPSAPDEPGNGVDEDCSGADLDASARPAANAGGAPAPGGSASGAAPAALPEGALPADLNLLLITVDTLRGDLGFVGYKNPQNPSISVSPQLDALAERAVVFENAYALASYTGKSVGPMLSGKYPSETHRGWSHFNSFTKDDLMLAERLQAAGVRTLSVQAHWYFDKCCGLSRGFDVVDMSAFPGAGAQAETDTSRTSDKLTDAAIRRLGDPANHAGRFFAWVHYPDPHADYLRHPDVPDFGKAGRGPYDHEVYFTDKHIGRLLAWLADQPFGQRTAVIVTSDHGEAFGEHKLFRHGFEIWDELVKVPLLIQAPGAAPRRVKARRSAVDLVPTALELMRVKPAEGAGPFDFVSGRSLAPELFGAQADERDVFVDMPAGPNNEERRALISPDGKKLYVFAGVRFQLFDLAADPAEKTDLAATDKALLAQARAHYDEFRAKLREVRVKPQPKD
ncbi:MAG TPA: sulfatase [Polyangiaceae bacterium]|nr:sulfatase [Polyangiaceae bacterium]